MFPFFLTTEVEDQQAAGDETGARFPSRFEVSIIASDRSDVQRFPRGIHEECMRFSSRPEKYDGHRDTETIEAFIVCLEACHRFHSDREAKGDCGTLLTGTKNTIAVATPV